jgi:hypothetical protein
MLELLHRWVRSYEVVAVRGSAQTQTQGHAELPPSPLPNREVAAAAHSKDTWDGVGQAWDADRQSSRHFLCQWRGSGVDRGAQYWPALGLANGEAAELIVGLRRAPGASQGGRTREKGDMDSSTIDKMEECEGEDDLVCNSSLSSEPPLFLQRNSSSSMRSFASQRSFSSMRSFASQRSLSSDYGGESNSFGRLLDVETELILA